MKGNFLHISAAVVSVSVGITACSRHTNEDENWLIDVAVPTGKLVINILEVEKSLESDGSMRVNVLNSGDTEVSLSVDSYEVKRLMDVYYQFRFDDESDWWEAVNLNDGQSTLLVLGAGQSMEFYVYVGPFADDEVGGLPKRLRISNSVSNEFRSFEELEVGRKGQD